MYIYNDCPPELTAAINQAIKEDAALNDKIVTLKRTAEQLDRLKLKSPSPKIIQAILDYAAKSARKQD